MPGRSRSTANDPQAVLPLARADLAAYCVAVYPTFEIPKHIGLLIDRLEAVERGQSRRLIVTMPPRHGKSLTASQLFPSWYLGRHPERSVICATYGQDLSDDFGRRTRNLLSDPLHQAIFPQCRLTADSTSQRRFDLTAGGYYYAVGRGGPITGRGASLLVLDDPLKDREEAHSETIRKGMHEWFGSVAFTRLTPDGCCIVIATRWHEDDLAGWLLREHAEEGWEVLHLPALVEGEALWERWPRPVLESIRSAIGSSAFACLYQGAPLTAVGQIFRREWFRTYREPPSAFKQIVQSWDTAYKTGSENDFSVCTTWGVADNGINLLSLWRGRVEFPELKRQLLNQAEAWKPHAILVEDKASGQSLVQELKQATSYPVLAVKVDTDKRARAEACTPTFEAGRIFLPESAPWLNDYQDEMASFPSGAHDDQVDSTTQALNWLRERTSDQHAIVTPGIVEIVREGQNYRDPEVWAKCVRRERLTPDEREELLRRWASGEALSSEEIDAV